MNNKNQGVKNIKKIIAIVVVIGLLLIVFLQLRSNKKVTESKVYHYDKEKPVTVAVDTVRLQTIDDEETYSGTFEPNKETRVSAETQGKINAVFVDVGRYVNAGQMLVQLDNSLLKLQLKSIEIQMEGLEDDVKRYTILTGADAVQGVQLEKAKLGLKSANVQKATLLEQINKSTIRAPFSGIITAKLIEKGAFAAPGVPLLQITDISQLKFTVNIPESELSSFHPHQNIRVSTDASPERELSGKVIMIGSKANPGNSFPIQIQVANTKNLDIKAGMFGRAHVAQVSQKEGFLIPLEAIVERDGESNVYVVKMNKAVLQPIQIAKSIKDKSVVSFGLKEGDVIITKGFINLEEGSEIAVETKSEELKVIR